MHWSISQFWIYVVTINCQRCFSENCQRSDLAQNIDTTASLKCLLCSLLSHFQLTNDKMVLQCHLIIKIWFKETYDYKQKPSEHKLTGIHTVLKQTYFPVNVQVPLTCITLKYHIQKWVSLTGLCSQKKHSFPWFSSSDNSILFTAELRQRQNWVQVFGPELDSGQFI